MQVERRVQHVEPRAGPGQPLHRPGVDLHDAAIGDKAHDRQLRLRRPLQHRFHRAVGHLLRQVLAGVAQRTDARDLVLAQHAEEVVRVFQAAPVGAQRFGVSGLGGFRGRRERRHHHGRRRRQGMPVDVRLPGRRVGLGGAVDLVHRLAGLVEELDAVPAVLGYRVEVLPRAEEHAQVDIRPEHDADRAIIGLDVLVVAMPLVHGGVVAGQRHDRPEGAEVAEHRLRGAAQLARGHAAAGGYQFGLGRAKAAGAFADAQVGRGGHQRVVALAQGFKTIVCHRVRVVWGSGIRAARRN
ncbi:hypothetical protein D3C86_1439980 [compost metagenome]